MQGLFSFLGEYDCLQTLNGTDNKLKEVFECFFPSIDSYTKFNALRPKIDYPKALDNISDFADFTINLLDKYNYLRLSDNTTLLGDVKNTFNLRNIFPEDVITSLKQDLKYVMIASWRYTTSMNVGIKIHNGSQSKPSYYISFFDGILKDGDGRKEIRKLLQNANVHLPKGEKSKFPTNMATTVLPQFIRRYYDMGITFENGVANYKGEPLNNIEATEKIKTPLMNSLFDIGPVLSLLDAKTPKTNPYIRYEKDNDGSGTKNTLKDKEVYADTNAFLQAFIKCPLNTGINNSVDNSNRILSAEQVLGKIADYAKTNENPIVLNFIKSISPEELVLFNQFAIERFTHAMFLEQTSIAHKDLYCNLYTDFLCNELIKERNDKYYSSSVNKEIFKKWAKNTGEILWNFYLSPELFHLSYFPLPRTRILLLNQLVDLRKLDSTGNINDIWPVFNRRLEELAPKVMNYIKEITSFIDFYVQITIPLSILAFHYLINRSKVTFTDDSIRDYFKQQLPFYEFYTYDESDTKICVNGNYRPNDHNTATQDTAFERINNSDKFKKAKQDIMERFHINENDTVKIIKTAYDLLFKTEKDEFNDFLQNQTASIKNDEDFIKISKDCLELIKNKKELKKTTQNFYNSFENITNWAARSQLLSNNGNDYISSFGNCGFADTINILKNYVIADNMNSLTEEALNVAGFITNKQ